MNLESRIKRAETRALGQGVNAARVMELAERGEFDLLTDAELDWLIAGGAPLSADTRAELDRLFESLSDDDLQAIIDTRELSPEGQAIMARCAEMIRGAK